MVQKIKEGKPHTADIVCLLKDLPVGAQQGLGYQRHTCWPQEKRAIGVRARRWEPPGPSGVLTLQTGTTTRHNLLSFPAGSMGATDTLPGWAPGPGVGLTVAVSGGYPLRMLSLGLIQGKAW